MTQRTSMGALTTLFWLTLFAIAMAHVEAALVVHLRSLYYPDNPMSIFPLNPLSPRDLWIELARETATLVMLVSVAALVERIPARVFAVFLYLFGIWDLAYYGWLKAMIDWPLTWLEWDILFLIPWVWLGPWLAAALIALGFVAWGVVVVSGKADPRFSPATLTCLGIGIALALAAFLSPAWPLLSGGEDALREFSPQDFPWLLYASGYVAMAAALGLAIQRRERSVRA